jgi:hypothetical protein
MDILDNNSGSDFKLFYYQTRFLCYVRIHSWLLKQIFDPPSNGDSVKD